MTLVPQASTQITITADEAWAIEQAFERLEEATLDATRMLAGEDAGWLRLSDIGESGAIPREHIKERVTLARLMALADPLIRRAVSLHVAYVWGQGVAISAAQEDGAEQDINGVVQAFLDDPSNLAQWSSQQAREARERAFQTDGEVFVALATSPLSGRVQVRTIPPHEIVEIITDPEDAASVWFYKRTYTARVLRAQGLGTVSGSEVRTTYYPAATFRPASRPRTIDGHTVEWFTPVVHAMVNASGGRGTPDVLAALPWAQGYKGFLEDWARIAKVLSRFAFRATAESGKGAAAVRAKFATGDETSVGQTAITSPGSKLEAIGKAGATIDANSGRPLGAMVAAATNLPVTMLLSDPGVSGARATAETLDRPLYLIEKARQSLHASIERQVIEYVIRESVRAPQGALKGSISRDRVTGAELVALRGDQTVSLTIDFPEIEELDPKLLVDAIVAADGTEKLPPLLIAKLLMLALRVEDVDEWLADLVDAEGNFVSPSDRADAASALNAVSRGDLPKE